jgi:NADH-dependent peroxiredoxin subunit F
MGIRFAGIPMGHEFTSLVLALLQAGGHPPKVDAAVIEQIQSLDGDFDFEVYISLSCQNCPEVVQAINLMAVLNPRVRATMIDGALFQAEVGSKQIMAVPSLYLNGAPFGQGRMMVEEIIAKLDKNAAARQAEALKSKAPFDVLIVGGGRRAQGHPHGCRDRALRRPGARHDGHREFHLREGNRGTEARRRAGEPRQDL